MTRTANGAASHPTLLLGLALLALAAFTACTAPDDALTADPADALVFPGGAVRGIVSDTAGAAVAGVSVLARGARADGTDAVAETDFQGTFLLRGLTPAAAVRLSFRHPDHAPSLQTVRIHDREVASAAVVLKRYGAAHVIESATGGLVTEGAATIHFPANGFVDDAGNAVTGPLQVRLATLDVSTPEGAAAPGDYVGRAAGGDTALTSFGMARPEVTQNGQEVTLAPGLNVAVVLELPPSLVPQLPAPGTDGLRLVPAWVFDEEQGIWVQTGTGAVAESHAGGGRLTWTAEMPTTRLWYNCDSPQPSTCVRGRVTDCAGNGIPGARVQVSGVSYTGTTGTTSGPGGRYTVRPVALDAQVTVEASLVIGGNTYKASVGPVTTPGAETECLELPEVRVAIPDVSGMVWLSTVEDRTQPGNARRQRQATAMFRATFTESQPNCGAVPELGTCSVIDTADYATANPAGNPPAGGEEGGVSDSPPWREALLDAGNRLELSASDENIILQRQDGEGGPTYASAPVGNTNATSLAYRLSAPAGGPDLDAFQVTDAVRLPEPLQVTGSSITLGAGSDLHLAWGPGDETTSVYLTLLPRTGGTKIVYCPCNDTGQITVPAAAIAALDPGDLTLTLSRTRVHYFPQPDGAAAQAHGVSVVMATVTR
jgi:hypothetical protein